MPSEQTLNDDPRTFAIIGAAMEAHRELGCGFLEPVYQEALALELAKQGIPFKREVELPLCYKGTMLATKYRVDFICYDSVLVELKALARLGGSETAQAINYLKASGSEIALLLNFGSPSLQFRRFTASPSKPATRRFDANETTRISTDLGDYCD